MLAIKVNSLIGSIVSIRLNGSTVAATRANDFNVIVAKIRTNDSNEFEAAVRFYDSAIYVLMIRVIGYIESVTY